MRELLAQINLTSGGFKAFVKNQFSKQLPAVLLAFGAGSNFILTLWVKKEFSSQNFNEFSLFVTYLGIISSFGFLGVDQVFIRLTEISKNKLVIPKNLFFLMIAFGIIVPVLVSLYFKVSFHLLDWITLVISGVGICISILNYNIYRLKEYYAFSQFNKILWRISLLLFSIAIPLLTYINNLNSIIRITAITVFVVGVIISVKARTYITYKNNGVEKTGFYIIAFVMNLGLITVLGYGERLIIAEFISQDVFGKYFYYSTVFLFPLTMIQQYVGFKEIVQFKNEPVVSRCIILNKVKKINFFGLLVLMVVFGGVVIDQGVFLQVDLINDANIVLLLILLGVIKLNYGLFSAVIGACGSYRDINILSIITVICMIFFGILSLFIPITIGSIVMCLILIFLLRSVYIIRSYVD